MSPYPISPATPEPGIRYTRSHNTNSPGPWEITGDGFIFRRDEEKIAAEARLDGIYVIRTTMTAGTADAPDVVRTYKNLKYVERDFKTIKIDDLDVRPIRHYLAGRVEAHLFICTLAAYLTWSDRRRASSQQRERRI